MKLHAQVAAKTDIGCVRTKNEDNFGYDTRYGIFVVCDGMGGQAAGEVASKIAVDTVIAYFREETGKSNSRIIGRQFEGVSRRANDLANSIQLANQLIHEKASENPAQAGMGSTVVAVCVEESIFSVAHVGDSRVYLVRQGVIQQLTNDHSLVTEQVRRGLISSDESQASDMQNIILRALGTEESVEPDLADHEALAGDLVLLCSDGLTKQMPDAQILDVISRG